MTKVKCIEALEPCFEKGSLVLSSLQQLASIKGLGFVKLQVFGV